MAVKRKNRQKTKSLDVQFNGPEPIVVAEKGYQHALNWYNYQYDIDDARKWLVEYAKTNMSKDEVKGLRNCPKHCIVTTAGWQARMILNGNDLSQSSLEFMNSRINAMVDVGLKTIRPKTSSAPVISIQERTKAKAGEIIALAESEVVDSRQSMYDFLIKYEVNKTIAEYIREYYYPVYEEVHSNDPEVKEMYGKNLTVERKFWKGLVDDLDRLISNKKVTRVRKPRSKKTKSAADLVKGLKYQTDSSQYKVVSVNPAHIVGCQQLWTFNTKSRLLTKYDAIGPAGLEVSRSTLKGFDPETSVTIKLRKPDDVLPLVLKSGKVTLRKLMDSVKAVQKPAKGRINIDTILLRVIK